MPIHTIVLLLLGGAIMAVGGVMQLVAAFRQSLWWGVASLFVPMASMVFVIMHWAEAKAGFLTGLVGAALLAGGLVTAGPLRDAYAAGMTGKTPFSFPLPESAPAIIGGTAGSTTTGSKDLNAQIQEKRDRIDQLEAQFGQAGVALVAQYQTLNTLRSTLRQDDAAALAKFNAANAAYQAQNAAQRERQQELAALQQSLDSLLAERARTQPRTAASGSSSATAGTRQVIMYTTSTCPACRAAKEYFARKGVHYEERDVNNSSSAREEFQRLGGTGVPLILVGNEKMEGFSAKRLDQLL
jgi:glutaredoxin 3